MNDIRVEFNYEGKHYKGFLSEVTGAGKLWHLMINNYYMGQLLYSEKYGWQFHNNKGTMKELADYFGKMVTEH